MDDSDVASLMNQADLVWTPRCPPGTVCEMAPLEATDPAAGSVVPVGTTVTAANATQRPDVTPPFTAADLDGNWVATMRFGREVEEAGRHQVLTFTPAHEWTGTDGCNTKFGKYSVQADGSFEVRVIRTTLVGCPGHDDHFSDVGVLKSAEHVSLENGVLTFMSGDGEVIGEYQRLTATEVTVPDVVGMLHRDAEQLLNEAGLVAIIKDRAGDSAPEGTVVEQSPAGGTREEPGSSVTLVVAAGANEGDAAAVTGRDRAVAEAFYKFAQSPSGGGPMDTPVQVGLGDSIRKQIPNGAGPGETQDPHAWVLRMRYYAARTGPVSPLELLRQSKGDYVLSVGPHPPCLGLEVTPPEELRGSRQISIQPNPADIDTCLDWWSVDLFVNDVGQVVGVTVTLSEP